MWVVFLGGLSTASIFALFGLLVWFANWVNRRLKLNFRSFRWIGAWALTSAVSVFLTQVVTASIVGGTDVPIGRSDGTFIAVSTYATRTIPLAGLFVAVLMFIAELATALSSKSASIDVGTPILLSTVRNNLTAIGVVLLALALTPLALASMYWWFA